MFDAPNPIRVIGTRHGEKLFETLLTREERVKAEDMGSYFRVPADNRDLNYNVYFAEGQETLSHEEDYHSHNTVRLDVDGMVQALLKLDYVQAGARELAAARPRGGRAAHEGHDRSSARAPRSSGSRASSRCSTARSSTFWSTPGRTTTSG